MNDGARAAGVHLTRGLRQAGSTLHPRLLISAHTHMGGRRGVGVGFRECLLRC